MVAVKVRQNDGRQVLFPYAALAQLLCDGRCGIEVDGRQPAVPGEQAAARAVDEVRGVAGVP